VTFASQLPFVGAAFGTALAVGGALRARRSISRWAFVAGMSVLAAEGICSGLSASVATPEDIFHWQQLRLLTLSLLPGVWLVFTLAYARGNAREFLNRWRLTLVAAFLIPPAVAIGYRDVLIVSMFQRTDGGYQWLLRLGWSGIALYLFLLVGSVLVLMNLERTFLASVGTIRWRVKFMLLGVGVLFLVRVYTSSQAVLYHGIELSLEGVNSSALIVAALLILRSLFRAGHFDLDVYPSQSLIQGSFTVLLAGIYLLLVGVLAKVVTYLGGDSTFTLKAFLMLVLLVILAVLLQSDRARLHLRRFVSRNFERPLYDYQTAWKKFTEATASRVEQTDLCRALVRMIADMFQTLSVSIWLLDDKQVSLMLVASTSLSSADAPGATPRLAEAGDVLRHFQKNQDPVDIETPMEKWAVVLRECQPSVFPNGGHRACIPLMGRGQVLGVITLADRVGGTPFSLQDFDMLKCVGDHAAGSLLNAQLSQRLLQAKELEAFQTMATFFVHDLKNAASTLNLMLQNLPDHFDDPAFRADALRGMEKTVTHINHLISRLGLLRHELKMKLVDADLGDVINQALAGLETGSGAEVTKELAPLPNVLLDPEQIAKVVINLVLNAREALPPQQGRIGVATSRSEDWAVITVTDNGSGMSPEFLARSLFRPFQTTKKNGLGIGMFQSKMIIEAHGGRIKVTSEPGKGTTFQVFLPPRRQPKIESEQGGTR